VVAARAAGSDSVAFTKACGGFVLASTAGATATSAVAATRARRERADNGSIAILQAGAGTSGRSVAMVRARHLAPRKVAPLEIQPQCTLVVHVPTSVLPLTWHHRIKIKLVLR
jgi:hypothetical protein